MSKRMTLLSRRDGMSVEAFRAHWAGPHADIALTIPGIAKYVQNRVEAMLWQRTGTSAPYQVDGIVEMSYRDEASMQTAQRCDAALQQIPDDEPNFIRGWTLTVVESEGPEAFANGEKVIILLERSACIGEDDFIAAVRAAFPMRLNGPQQAAFNWTLDRKSRPSLWHEPRWPDVFVNLWFQSHDDMTDFFASHSSDLRSLDRLVGRGAAYHVDALCLKGAERKENNDLRNRVR